MLTSLGQVNKTEKEFLIKLGKIKQVDHNLVVSRIDYQMAIWSGSIFAVLI